MREGAASSPNLMCGEHYNMVESLAVIDLLDGVHCSAEVLTYSRRCSLAGLSCRVCAPGPPPAWIDSKLGPLEPPRSQSHNAEVGWPTDGWGYINSYNSVTIRALGLVVSDGPPSTEEGLAALDRVVLRVKTLLRDWLAVLAEGPADFLTPTEGISWVTAAHDDRLLHHRYRTGMIYEPHCRVSRWEWGHAMEQALEGHPAPLSRKLIALAMRDAAIGDGRNAVIHAATAAEHALTVGLEAALSQRHSADEAKARLRKNRMFGRRLRLARNLGLEVPEEAQADLVDPRNAAVHAGDDIHIERAWAAVEIGRAIVNEFAPLPANCREPGMWEGGCPHDEHWAAQPATAPVGWRRR